jgi:hypothetical protein
MIKTMQNKASKITLTVVCAGILVFGASFAKAQSTDEYIKALQTQIQTLLRYIQQLQLQLMQKTTTTTTTIPTSTSTPTNKFFIMEDDGNLLSENNNIIQVDTIAAAQRFYKSFNDDYDFLTFFTAFSTNQQPATRSHATISNNVKGINSAINDFSQDYGSKGRLKGINFMQSIDEYDIQDPLLFSPFLHETGHQWLVYIGYHADGNKLNVTQDRMHWSEETNTDWDPLGGVRYKDNRDGTFTRLSHSSGEPWQYYCPQSLYLMGLLPPNEIPDLMVVTPQDPVCFNNKETCPGTARYVSVKDIITVEGERLPSSADSQKDFRMAFILITKKGQKPTDEQIKKMNYIVENFPNIWAKATRNLSTMSTDLLSIPSLICTDSDGGNNPYVKGTVTLDSQTYTDSCSTINTLKEYYCANDQIQNYMVICPSGYTCQDGACKPSITSLSVDLKVNNSDGPITVPFNSILNVSWNSTGATTCIPLGPFMPLVKGGIWAPSNYSPFPLSGTEEIYAQHQGLPQDTVLDIGISCSKAGYSDVYDHVIVNLTSIPHPPTCTDSDGGKNYYVKGAVTSSAGTTSDACVAENLSNPTSILSEYYCENGVVKNELFTCPTGYTCQDGACKLTVVPTLPSYGKCSDGTTCGWCGNQCTKITTGMDCPQVMPPSGATCTCVNNRCTIQYSSSTNILMDALNKLSASLISLIELLKR